MSQRPKTWIKLQATSERIAFRVEQERSPGTHSFEFDLTPRQAMTIMRALQAYQRRYRWSIPMIPTLERAFRQDNPS